MKKIIDPLENYRTFLENDKFTKYYSFVIKEMQENNYH